MDQTYVPPSNPFSNTYLDKGRLWRHFVMQTWNCLATKCRMWYILFKEAHTSHVYFGSSQSKPAVILLYLKLTICVMAPCIKLLWFFSPNHCQRNSKRRKVTQTSTVLLSQWLSEDNQVIPIFYDQLKYMQIFFILSVMNKLLIK